MDANFGPDVSEDGADKPESSRNKVVVAAIALGALVGLGVGVGAFGITAAMHDGSLFGASSEEALEPMTSAEPSPEKQAEPSLIRATETTTKTPTPTTVTSTSVHEPGESERSSRSTAPTSRHGSDDAASRRTASDEDGPGPSVVPEPVLRPKSTTPTPTSAKGAGDEGRDNEGKAPTSASPTGTSGKGEGERDTGTPTPTSGPKRDGEDGQDKPVNPDRSTQVPTGDNDEPKAPPKPEYPADASNAELEGQLRAATSPATPNEERVRRFEQGASAQPVINMMSGLTTGSVAPTSWEFVGPVRVTEGRAETRMRINTPIPTEHPAVFVWRDGEWKISRETTCELAKAMLMQCPA